MPTTKTASPRKATARKTAGRKAPVRKTAKRKPLSKEAKAKLAKNLVKARAARAAKRVASGAPPPKPKRQPGAPRAPRDDATREAQAARTARTKLVKTYLESLQTETGEPVWMSAMLNGPGLPGGRSNDPDKIEEAANVVESQIPTTVDPLKRLKLIKKLREWRALVERLREEGDGPEAEFIRVGKEWCAENGYTYAIMRDIGVPAAVLKEAEIE